MTYEGDLDVLIRENDCFWYMDDYLDYLCQDRYKMLKRRFYALRKVRLFDPLDYYVWVDEKGLPHSFPYESDFRRWLYEQGYRA